MKINSLCIAIIFASAVLGVSAYSQRTESSSSIHESEIFQPRQTPPLNTSQWKPKSIKYQVTSQSSLEYLSEDKARLILDKEELTSATNKLDQFELPSNKTKDVIDSVHNDTTQSIRAGRRNQTNEFERSRIFNLPSYGEILYDLDRYENAIYATTRAQPANPKKICSLDRIDWSFSQLARGTNYTITRFDEVFYPQIHESTFDIYRVIGMGNPELVLSGAFQSRVKFFDAIPSRYLGGSHLIIQSDYNFKAFSNGKEWNLQSPPGYTAVPRAFLTNDTIAGMVVKYDSNQEVASSTIAFWNRGGQYSLIDDLVPDSRTEFETLLSTKSGFTPSLRFFISNYMGKIAIGLDNGASEGLGPNGMDTERKLLVLSVEP